MKPMRPDTPDKRVKRELEKLKRQVAEERSGARKTGRTTFSKEQLTVNKGADIAVEDGGAVRVSGGGGVRVGDEGDIDFEDGGRLIARYPSGREMVMVGTTNLAQGRNGLWVFSDSGSLDPAEPEKPRQLFGAVQDAEGGTWTYTDGDRMTVKGNQVEINTLSEDLRVYGLPTTTQAGNLRLQVDGGIPRLYYGTTSDAARKTDLAPLSDVSVEDVLAIDPQTWTEGDDQVIGVTVEQLQTIGAVAPLLVRPGYPDGHTVEYERLSILQQVVLREQQQQIADLQAKAAAQEAENTAMRERLDAMETRLDQMEA